ncbi:Desert hedgehog protein [Seminavis robusta]|uniref:Desert hedgehog protein n=1 Tax=Seminavis robusta TaxID=568900 RepID=A0A9N8E695_9STRA|nr:Desert hedgehog protein [Seminavis robusta]|eukprot:Sro540_g163050.1 Desert hedgehog protein (249) ;mRNA; f:55581-56327
MQKLKVGDKVQTTTETDTAEYQPVYAFGHRSPTTLGRFLQITTDTDSLEITSEHLLYIADKSHPVRADSIIVGDKLQTADGSANQVKKIKTVMKEGLYAPLTPSGKLVINGIQTSAYIALQKDDQELFTTLNGLITIPHSSYIHLYLAPLRVVCLGVSSMPCQLIHENGMPLYIKWGIDAINMAHGDSNVYTELLFAVISGIFLSGFVAVEALFGATLGPLIVFSVCFAYSFVRKTHAVKTNNAKKAA